MSEIQRDPMATIAKIRTERGLELFLAGSALQHVVEISSRLEESGMVDPNITRRCVLSLSTKLICENDRRVATDAERWQVSAPAPVAAIPAPRIAAQESDVEESAEAELDDLEETERPRRARKPSLGANRFCPVCHEPISHQAIACVRHWRQVKKERAAEKQDSD